MKRILLSCLQGRIHNRLPAYGFWRGYFKHGIVESGHAVLECPSVDWAEGLIHHSTDKIEEWRARTWGLTVDFIREEHNHRGIDLFLGYLYPGQIDCSAIEAIRRLGIPCVNFFCDNYREFSFIPKEYHNFDLNWVPEREALPMYQTAGLNYIHLPMPCWIPNELRNPPLTECEPPTFIGSADLLRRDLIGRAYELGADFVVRGPGWNDKIDGPEPERPPPRTIARLISNQMSFINRRGIMAWVRKIDNSLRPIHSVQLSKGNIRDAVSASEYVRITREAMVTIGVNRVPTDKASNRRPLAYSRLRDIEAPMLGACYLSEWTEGLAGLYELGREIETYRTAEELTAKLVELRKDRRRREAMRQAAQRRALEEHSVTRSLNRILERLGILAGA